MPIKCPKGQKQHFRFRKTKKKNVKVRLGGCAKKGKFTEVKEVVVFRKGKKVKVVNITKRKSTKMKSKKGGVILVFPTLKQKSKRKLKFGSVAWQNKMEMQIKKKVRKSKLLTSSERSFIEVQIKKYRTR